MNDYRRLPSIRALQALDAAARLRSFTQAAAELNVSQGAISRQIQAIEQIVGQPLFQRAGPNLTLNTAGRQFATDGRRVLEQLAEAVAALRPEPASRQVTLSMLPSVAAKFLAPRLADFITAHPDIDLRVTASRNFVDFRRDGVDGAIRYGLGQWPNVDAHFLAGERVCPVCTPEYAERLALTTPGDVQHTVLLHNDIEQDWQAWFQAAGLETKPKTGPRLGDDTAMLQAALDGQGLALGRSMLVSDDIAAGRLVAPFAIRLPASFSYWFVTPHRPAGVRDNPNLTAVRDWVIRQFATSAGAGTTKNPAV